MTKPFKQLLAKMPPERQKRIGLKTALLKNEIALKELREALDLTQQEIANRLNLKQAAISKFERQSDIYISTLRKILFAMGADLKIVAHFKSGEVVINQFTELHSEPSPDELVPT